MISVTALDSTPGDIPYAFLEPLRLQKEPGFQEESKRHRLGLARHPCSLPTSGLNGIFPRTHPCLLPGLAFLGLTARVFISKIKNVQDQDVARRHSASAASIWALFKHFSVF